jgi:hypothetical protein
MRPQHEQGMLIQRNIRHKPNSFPRVRQDPRNWFSPAFSGHFRRFLRLRKILRKNRRNVCSWHSVSFENVAALAVATLDLELVKLLRGAIRAADMAGGKLAPDGTAVPGPRIEPRKVIEPTPRFLPRKVIHPSPRFEPRFVVHPASRIEVQPAPPAADPEHPRQSSSPIQPPWKQLVWNAPIPKPVQPKVVQYRTDIQNKGSLLDLFI